MPRSREFDEQTAIDGAMRLFWRQGYQAASLNDLLEATDLSRSSFYEAFGTKRDLLLTALRRYAESSMAGLTEALRQPAASRAEIELTLRRMVAHALSEDGQRGCLVNNCTTEIAPHEPEVLDAVRAIRAQLEDALVRAVSRGQKDGTITSGEKPRALARFLVNTFSGINVAARSRPSKAMLDDIVRVALRVLD